MAGLLVALTSLALAGLFCGCSKSGSSGAAKVDLSAQREALKSPDKDTRINAFVALGSMKEAAAPAVPDIISHLKDPDPEIRRLAAYALGEIGPAAKEALPQLKTMMSDSEVSVVTQVVNSMRSINPNEGKEVDLQKVLNQ
jgi:HEAT repeat protein